LAVVFALGGLNALGVYAEGQQDTPTEDACMAIVNYHLSSPHEEAGSDALDRLRYVEGRLTKATAPEAVVIRQYLAYELLYRGAGTRSSALLLETDDVGLAAWFVRAAQVCTDLGHPQLQEYLYDKTRDEYHASQ
jgi:hypothetical protein